MDSAIDLSDEDDVYANIRRNIESDFDTRHYELQIVSEAAPTSLPRIFGLLSSLSIVPLSTSSSSRSDSTIDLHLHLVGVDLSTIDLLRRKIAQLTETVMIAGKSRINLHGD